MILGGATVLVARQLTRVRLCFITFRHYRPPRGGVRNFTLVSGSMFFSNLSAIKEAKPLEIKKVKIKKPREKNGLFTRILSLLKILLRAFKLYLICTPLILTAPFAYYSLTYRESSWFVLLVRTLESCGPIFIKLGQWASTRRDLFPPVLCAELSKLQRNTKPHPWSHTHSILTEAYGNQYLGNVFKRFDPVPIGSGCCAQVYKGVLKDNRVVAVKVLHPDIDDHFKRDLNVMRVFISCISWIMPSIMWLSPAEFLEEFAYSMTQQIDLTREVENLQKFRKNFENSIITFPEPFPELSRSDIIVETFEPGDHISNYIGGGQSKEGKNLADMGIEMLLQMVFKDNFVHGDLHPGNILVNPDHLGLVVLDPGIASSLSDRDLDSFKSVFSAVVRGDATKVGHLFLERSNHQCESPGQFIKDMNEIVMNARSDQMFLSRINVTELLNRVFNTLRLHKVKLEANFCSVILSIMVLEGLGKSLDPELDLMSKLKLSHLC